MPIQAAIAELRSSRRWVTIMSVLAIILISLWVLLFTAIWFRIDTISMYTAWKHWYFLGFTAQITLFAYAAIIPFINLNRYAESLRALGEDDREGLARVIELNVRFWRQCSYLMWGMAWLLVYLLGGGIIDALIGGK